MAAGTVVAVVSWPGDCDTSLPAVWCPWFRAWSRACQPCCLLLLPLLLDVAEPRTSRSIWPSVRPSVYPSVRGAYRRTRIRPDPGCRLAVTRRTRSQEASLTLSRDVGAFACRRSLRRSNTVVLGRATCDGPV